MAPTPSYVQSFNYIHNEISQHLRRTLARPKDPLPATVHALVIRDDDANTPNPKYHPGLGAKDPNTFNNKGFFALFALLGAAMVVASIWFFFWAPNGGFVWRSGDWDDYKSTVLRRKDKDGKTLSGATKTTDLGQKSIAGTFDIDHRAEMAEVQNHGFHDPNRNERPGKYKRREPSDEDLRAYRHEKPARVGGLNREQDGSNFDFTNTDRSDVTSNSDNSLRPLKKRDERSSTKKKTYGERKREKKQDKERAAKAHEASVEPQGRTTSNPNPAYRQSNQTYESPFSGNSPQRRETGYPEIPRYPPPMAYAARHESPLRHSSPRQGNSGTPTRSARATPRSHRRSQPSQPRPPGSWDAYSETSSDTGTKAYEHHIPGLSRGDAVRDQGFRRGYGGQRDSLYGSDGNAGTTRY